MQVYKIEIFDKNWKTISVDYKRFTDRQQAELRAEKDRDWLDANGHYEITRIR